MKNATLRIFVWLACVTALYSCTKYTDYQKYLDAGERVYTARVDSLKAIPGYNRLQLSWLLISDQRITGTKVYWNSRADSLSIQVKRSAGIDTFRVMIDTLPEGAYEFEVVTYDGKGHFSVPAQIVGRTYGARYEETLSNRNLLATYSRPTGPDTWVADIRWAGFSPLDGLVSMRVRYTDVNGTDRLIDVPADPAITLTTLEDFTFPGTYTLSTGYQPEKLMLDTFYARARIIQLP
jgi:hypothetical protein